MVTTTHPQTLPFTAGCVECWMAVQNFISDIRGSQNKEQEERRIDKELAKIRAKFSDDKSLNGVCAKGRVQGCK